MEKLFATVSIATKSVFIVPLRWWVRLYGALFAAAGLVAYAGYEVPTLAATLVALGAAGMIGPTLLNAALR